MSRVIFPEWTQTLKKATRLLILGAPVYLVLLIAFGVSDGKAIRIGYQPDQPVPYSHALHAGELGIDCRYCHSTVERAAKAAIPPAATCMNCHASVRPESPLLLPVREAFAGVAGIRPLDPPAPGVDAIYHLYVLRAERRDALQAHLREQGIGCGVYYPLPLHLQACFAPMGYRTGDLPAAEAASAEVLALPMYAELSAEARGRVIDAVRAFAR